MATELENLIPETDVEVEGMRGPKGDKGDSYVLTEADKEEIAQKVDKIIDAETDKTLTLSGKPADAKAAGDEINDLKADLSEIETDIDNFSDVIYTEKTVSQNLPYVEKASRIISATGIEDTTSTSNCVYTFPLSFAKEIVLYAQSLSNNYAYYAFYDADTAAECSSQNIIGSPTTYPNRVDTTVSVPQNHCLLCICAITGRDATVTITKKLKSILDEMSDEIQANADNISSVEEAIEGVSEGLTETMQTPQILPAGTSITGTSGRDVAGSVDMLRVLNGQKALFDGTATHLKFLTPPQERGFAKTVTLFQFRLSNGTYEEIYRNTFMPNGDNIGEYDIEIPVLEGDVFGIGGYCAIATSGDYGKTLELTFDENTVTFLSSELSGANQYNLAKYDVTIVPSIDVAKKAQMSLLNSPITLMRNWDVQFGCGKNIVDTSKWVYCQVSSDGISRTTLNKVTLAKVSPLTMYSITRGSVNNLAYGDGYVAFIDADGTILSVQAEKDMAFTQEMGKCFITPAGCNYIALNILGRHRRVSAFVSYDDTETLMVEQGNHNTPYEPYTTEVSSICGSNIRGAWLKSNSYEYDAPINLVVIGDSIASDAVDSQLQSLGHWFYPMIEKYSFKSARDLGVGGACWTHSADTVESITYDSQSNSNVLTNQVNKLIDGVTNSDWEIPDVIFIHCGINDRSHALDGGTGTDYGDPETVFDYDVSYENVPYGDVKLQNLCGAMRFAIELIWRNFPYTKIILTTPLHTGSASSNTKTFALNKTIKECASYLAIPVLDLGFESYVYAPMASNYLVDGLHPNIEKGGKFLADTIGHYLISKFGGKPFFDLHETT